MKVGFLSILTLIFVIAKLTGTVAWSWWIVFLPFMISAAGLFAALVLVVIAEWSETDDPQVRKRR